MTVKNRIPVSDKYFIIVEKLEHETGKSKMRIVQDAIMLYYLFHKAFNNVDITKIVKLAEVDLNLAKNEIEKALSKKETEIRYAIPENIKEKLIKIKEYLTNRPKGSKNVLSNEILNELYVVIETLISLESITTTTTTISTSTTQHEVKPVEVKVVEKKIEEKKEEAKEQAPSWVIENPWVSILRNKYS